MVAAKLCQGIGAHADSDGKECKGTDKRDTVTNKARTDAVSSTADTCTRGNTGPTASPHRYCATTHGQRNEEGNAVGNNKKWKIKNGLMTRRVRLTDERGDYTGCSGCGCLGPGHTLHKRTYTLCYRCHSQSKERAAEQVADTADFRAQFSQNLSRD